MYHHLKITHHQHSGRVRPHEYTSYIPLFILLVIVGVILGLTSVLAFSQAASPGPESRSIGLTGTMPGPPPTTAAVILNPKNQQRLSASPVDVNGTCPAKTLVQIFKNDIFAGSTTCSDSGSFSIDIDLLIGENVLIARVYNDLNEPGPDSAPVTVFYDALPPQASSLSPLNFGGAQLILNTDAVYRGIFPDKQLNIPVDIIGGTPPYALNVQWGDSTNKVVPRNDNTRFTVDHIYTTPGVYQITLQARDAADRVAFLTVAAFVNGQPPVDISGNSPIPSTNKLLALWPLYTGSLAVVISFWLGERREKRILTHHTAAFQ